MIRPYQGTKMDRIRNETITQFSFFIYKIHDKTPKYSRAKLKHFSIINIIKVLHSLEESEQNFNSLMIGTGICMKKSLLNYLKLCVSFSFIRKERYGHNVEYNITERGKILLDLFKECNNE